MKFPNWAKIVLWIVLILGAGTFLYVRRDPILAGEASNIDMFAVAIGAALLIAPIFVEMEFLGVKLKQHIDEVKRDFERQIYILRSEIKAEIQSNVNNNVTFQSGQAPPDSVLRENVAHVKEMLERFMSSRGDNYIAEKPAYTNIDDDTLLAFTTRYSIEKELVRIAQNSGVDLLRKRNVPYRLARDLVELELLPSELEKTIRDVYAICSPAIHGNALSLAQASYLKDVGPPLIATLQSIRPEPWSRPPADE